MIPFFRKNKRSDPAPEWSSFSSLSDYEEFQSLVKKYFDRKKIPYRIEEDSITTDDADWPFGQMGLSNLAQTCNQNPRPAWKTIVKSHFDNMVANREFEDAFYEKAHDYSYASPYIGVRIYPNDYISIIGEEATIKRPLSEDLSAILVFDFPHAISNIKPEKTIQWNKTNEQLYEIGLANIRMKYPTEVSAETVNGSKIWFLQADHLFAANSILELHMQAVPEGTHGSLVGIPHRHTVLIYPIEDLGVIAAIQPFIFILRGMYKDGPGSISQGLYWHRDGQLTKLDYQLEGDELNFRPTDEFLEMMDSLPPKK